MPPTRSQSFICILGPDGFGVERFTCETHWWPLPSGCAFHWPGHQFSDMSVNGYFFTLWRRLWGEVVRAQGLHRFMFEFQLRFFWFFHHGSRNHHQWILAIPYLGLAVWWMKGPPLMRKSCLKKYHWRNITRTSLGALLPEARPLLKDQTTYSEFAKNSTPSTWKVAGIIP